MRVAYCPACGSELGAGDDFCRACGRAVGDEGSWTVEDDGPGAGGSRTGRGEGDRSRRSKGSFGFAFSYPLEDGVGPVAKAGLALIGSVLVVPFLMFLGYVYRIGRAAALGREHQPPFDDWLRLTKEGFLFSLLYGSLVVGAFVVWTVVLFPVVAVTGDQRVADVLAGVSMVTYFPAVGYAIPAVLTLYVATGSVRSALSWSRFVDFAVSKSYLKAWLIYWVLGAVLTPLYYLSLLTIVGVFFVWAYSGMVVASYWGHVYYRTTGEGGGEPPSDAEDTVDVRRVDAG